MTIVGMLRVKNEARWIERCVRSLAVICSTIIILDDHSEDGTSHLASAALPGKVLCLKSPFTEGDTNEVRDKNYLLELTAGFSPDWVVAIDGDEEMHWQPGRPELMASLMAGTPATAISLPILYLWDREDQMRTDGVYGKFRRESIFRWTPGAQFHGTEFGGNFHCGNVPQELRNSRVYAEVPLLHYGYMHREDRIRKHQWYNLKDPDNASEDKYRHMVQGDGFGFPPAEQFLKHAGPLKLIPR